MGAMNYVCRKEIQCDRFAPVSSGSMDMEYYVTPVRQSWNNSLINLTSFVALILLIAFASPVAFNGTALYAILGLFLLFFLHRRRKIDKIIIYLTAAWILVNIANIAFRDEDLGMNLVLGFLLRLYISYLGLKIIGNNFWKDFNDIVYLMTKISLIIYAALLIVPSLNYSLASIFGQFISPVYRERFPDAWHAFFYTNLSEQNTTVLRNAGFMWEPGAFGMIMVVCGMYHWTRNGVYMDRKSWAYFLGIITTFSTSAYLCLLIFLLIYLKVNRLDKALKLILIALSLFGLYLFKDFDFLLPKIMLFLEENAFNISGYNNLYSKTEYNRIIMFKIYFEKILEFPFGYGMSTIMYQGEDFVGVNGLGDILRRWGFGGLFFVITGIFLFFSRIVQPGTSNRKFLVLLAALSVGVVFFSNPVAENPLMYLLVLTPFIYKDALRQAVR